MIDFTTLTLVDYGIVLVFILSATMSILRGLTREILGLAGWGISILIANYSAGLIEDPIVDFGLDLSAAPISEDVLEIVLQCVFAQAGCPALS